MLAQTHKSHTMSSVGLSEDVFSRTSQLYLNETLRMLMELSAYWASVQRVKIASESVVLYNSTDRRNSFFSEEKDPASTQGSSSQHSTVDATGHSLEDPKTAFQTVHDGMQAPMYKHISIINLQEHEVPHSPGSAIVRYLPPAPNGTPQSNFEYDNTTLNEARYH